MKKILQILIWVTMATLVGTLVAHAADYIPLAPLPGTTEGAVGSETTNLSVYLTGAIKLIVALGAAFAVLMMIVGGTQYVASGIAPSAKNDAKEHIQSALIGLILILVSYLILNSINPKLVAFNLMLPPIGVSPGAGTGGAGTQPAQPEALSAAETIIRGQLTGVTVVRDFACQGMSYQDFAAQYPGKGCTTMESLPPSAITGVNALKNACASCTISITGGTEAGHTTHGAGFAIIDIGKNPTLDSFITTGRTPQVNQGCGVGSAPHYQVTGAGAGTYVDEGTHWHVCY